MPSHDPDEQLYKRLLRCDPGALETLFRKYQALLWYVVCSRLRDVPQEDVEEIFADVLLGIWQDIKEYDPARAQFKTWIVLRARWAVSAFRRKRDRTNTMGLPPLEDESQGERGILLRMDLSRALLKLKPSDRQILYLCDYLQWEHRRVAEHLDIKTTALTTRLHRARKRIRRSLHTWRLQWKEQE